MQEPFEIAHLSVSFAEVAQSLSETGYNYSNILRTGKGDETKEFANRFASQVALRVKTIWCITMRQAVHGELLNCSEFREFSVSCYDADMRNLVILFVHLLTTVARLASPGGVRSVVAESVLVKHQLLILNRSRQRAPNLRLSDRIVAGWCALFMRPSRLILSAIVLKPSTLLRLHQILTKRKYRLLF